MATIHALQIFLSVCNTRSITETARLFYCSQPSVSRIIHDLEEEYHVRLFERYHNRLIPTPDADKLCMHAMHLSEDYEIMNRSMMNRSVTIRLGSTVTISNTILTSILHTFHQTCPDVRVEITVNNGAFLQNALLENRLDIALIEDSIHYDDLNSVSFGKDQLVLIVPDDHPFLKRKKVYLKDLNHQPFLHRDRGSAVREYLDTLFGEKKIQVDVIWQSTSTHAILNAVSEGFGITILPEKMCSRELALSSMHAIHFTDHDLSRKYYAVTHREKTMSEEMTHLLSLIQKPEDYLP